MRRRLGPQQPGPARRRPERAWPGSCRARTASARRTAAWRRPAARSARAWAAAARRSRPRRSAAAAATIGAASQRQERQEQRRADLAQQRRPAAARARGRRSAADAVAPARRGRRRRAPAPPAGATAEPAAPLSPNSRSVCDLARDDELALGARLLEPALRRRFGFLAIVAAPRPCSAARLQPADAADESASPNSAMAAGSDSSSITSARSSCSGRARKKTGKDGTMRPMAPEAEIDQDAGQDHRRGDPGAGGQRVAAQPQQQARRRPRDRSAAATGKVA